MNEYLHKTTLNFVNLILTIIIFFNDIETFNDVDFEQITAEMGDLNTYTHNFSPLLFI